MSRRGWTLHEMIISLSVMAVAAGLAAHAAVGQLRFFRGAGDIVAVRGQAGAVGAIVAAALWGVSPAGGDIQFASDSALEVRSATGSTVVCESAPGRVTIPAAEPRGNTLSAFDAPPDAGDIADAFIADSVATGWVRATILSSTSSTSPCAPFPQASATISIVLREPLVLPPGTLLRISRPVRMSHYRAADGLWYFGVRDWNSATQRLNTVQPVAGPLEPHSADPGRTGLAFLFFDDAGAELPPTADLSRVATVTVLVRARTRKPVRVAGLGLQAGAFVDSTVTTIALRNAQ